MELKLKALAFRDIILDNEQEESIKYKSKKDILNFIDLSKDGIERETVKEIVRLLPKVKKNIERLIILNLLEH